jgi:radical SAM protein with 4Fe4S-binding SPASM domain
MLFWESTARCNLDCRHCRRLDTQGAPDELTTAEAKAMLDSSARLGRPVVVFSGGEPLMREDWRELADHAGTVGLKTALATNGTLVDAERAKRIAQAGFHRVSVSLDGADTETHDDFRGQTGCFERAVAGLRNLRDAGATTQINFTVTTFNAEQLDGVYTLAESLGAAALHLFLLVPVGCGAELAPDMRLAGEAYERALNWICDRQQAGPLEVRATCGPQYYRVAAQRGLQPARRGSRGCLCGISVAFLSHRGEVFPCGYLPVSCGNVRQTPLPEIWQTSEVFADLRDFGRLGGKCGGCEYKAVCGGCRARAYAAKGDYLAAEPACSYQPGR